MPSSPDPLEAEMVMAGERSPAAMASELAAFIDGAVRTLDVAIYDFEADRGSATPGRGHVGDFLLEMVEGKLLHANGRSKGGQTPDVRFL